MKINLKQLVYNIFSKEFLERIIYILIIVFILDVILNGFNVNINGDIDLGTVYFKEALRTIIK